jgi:hypothetical protein
MVIRSVMTPRKQLRPFGDDPGGDQPMVLLDRDRQGRMICNNPRLQRSFSNLAEYLNHSLWQTPSWTKTLPLQHKPD